MSALNSITGCPTQEALSAFSQGQLPASELETIAEHLSVCTLCAKRVDTLVPAADDLVADLRGLAGAAATSPEPKLNVEMLTAERLGDHLGDHLGEQLGEEAGFDPLRASPRGPASRPPSDRFHEYRLLERLGQGGMGTVYRALHLRLERVVAIKLLSSERMRDPSSIARFQREMRAVGKLAHPNIVQATDAGEVEGMHYLVMEFVSGIDLARLIRRHGKLSVADTCELVRQAALGLQHAHARGIVHRDVKPSNLILSDAGQVKLLDLGLVRMQDRGLAVGDSTASDAVMGSFDYMAPEQADNAHGVDSRADLYSLGCTLFHLLTGGVPYGPPTYTSPLKKLQAHASAPVPDVRQLGVEAPEALQALLSRLLAKAPSERPATAAEVVAALEPLAAGADLQRLLESISGPLGEETLLAPEIRPVRALPEPTVRVPPPRSRSATPWIAAASILALLLTAGVIYVQTDKGTIEIVTDDDDVQVSVLRGGKEVEILHARDGSRHRLSTGEYELKLLNPDKQAEVKPDRITLRRGDKASVTIRRLGGEASAARGFPPLNPGWVQALAALPVAKQVEELAEELKRRNPGFDGKCEPTIESRAITGLNIPSEHVADLTPVQALPKLTTLACWGAGAGKSKLKDLTPLRATKLQRLTLVYSLVNDLRPLRELPLTELVLSGSQVRELEALLGMQLKTLHVGYNAIDSLEPLRGMPLQTLHCGGTLVEDLSPLKGMQLQSLDCSEDKVTDISPLEGMPLKYLHLRSTGVGDVRVLRGMPLETLLLPETLEDVRGLEDLPQLKTLELSPRAAAAADFLRGHKTLKQINNKPIGEFWKQIDLAKGNE
jgi:serine/threonine protein kinase